MLSRLSSALSVRSRLIVLSLDPRHRLCGGRIVLSVERARRRFRRSPAWSSRAPGRDKPGFQGALVAMQMSAKDYVAQPQPGLASRFDQAQEAAPRSLKTLAGAGRRRDKADHGRPARACREPEGELCGSDRRTGQSRPHRVRRHSGQPARTTAMRSSRSSASISPGCRTPTIASSCSRSC